MKAKKISNEEQCLRLSEEIHAMQQRITQKSAALRDCERECERLRAELAQARDRDDGR